MLYKSLLVSVILLSAYSFYINKSPKKNTTGQHQWQDNQISAQNYIYEKHDEVENVFVGSSLSCRLVRDSLPPSFYCLAFGGQSAIDGLEILTRSSTVPKRVFIETNIIHRQQNQAFIDDLFTPFIFSCKGIFPILLDKNQPAIQFLKLSIPYIGNKFIDPLSGRYVVPIIKRINAVVHNVNKQSSSEQFSNHIIEMQVKTWNNTPDTLTLSAQLEKMKRLTDVLISKGTEIVFYEMPVNPAILNTKQYLANKQMLLKYFPPSKFVYMDYPTEKYQTGDGIHLGREEAGKYTRFFSDWCYKNQKL